MYRTNRKQNMIGGNAKRVLAALLIGSAVLSAPTSVSAAGALPLCASAAKTVERDVKLRDAVNLALGAPLRYLPESDSTHACMFPAAALDYPDARVLIMASIPGADSISAVTSASLSAYFLRLVDGHYRLVTVRRDFADGGGQMGNVGKLTAIRYGTDEGLMVDDYSSGQGYSYSFVSLYVFGSSGIVSLGTVPTGFSNDGAMEDESKVLEITGQVAIGQPQADLVRVVYTSTLHGKTTRQTVDWQSRNGTFKAVASVVPKELTR